MPDAVRPRLAVLIVSYNHQAYIRKAVESVLMQKVPEPFEVVVADDGSTDDTRRIIEETLVGSQAAPSFRYLDYSANRGITENYRRSFAACDTEYVAVIEGDDYWINPGKLAAQMAFLDEHRECAAVSSNYFVYDEKRASQSARSRIDKEFSYIDARQLIHDNLIGNFSTCMYRLEALKSIPELLYRGIAYDWGVNICVARCGLIGFHHTPFSVYRVHDQGTWNGLAERERIETQLRVIDHYNKCTDFVFDSEFQILAKRLERSLARTGRDRPWPRRIGAILLACVPFGLVCVLRWMLRFLIPPIVPITIRKMRTGGRR
jgi:glycosyltransferase involved in cell wall biosynthesis